MDVKGSEEGGMNLGVQLSSLSTWRGLPLRVRFMSGQGNFGDVPPSSLEGLAFQCVLVRLVAQLGLSVSFT